MRVYMAKRYHEKRGEMIEKLGGKCSKCGLNNGLQIDHIDPAKKTMRVARMTYVGEERRKEEMKNCQLLCSECHTTKTVTEDLGRELARGTHGTLSSYRYCKCSLCKKAKAGYMRERRSRS